MTFAKFTRSVFLALSFLFAQELVAQQIVTSSNPNPTPADATKGDTPSNPKPAPQTSPVQHKLGPLDFTVNWRFRTEAWDFFQPPTPAENAYAFEHSLLRVGLG